MKFCPNFALILPFLAGVGLCALFVAAPLPVAAAAPFSDDFDTYPVGNIEGLGNWFKTSGSGCVVTDIKATSGDNSVACEVNQVAYNKNNAVALMSGIWYFDLWLHPNQTTTTPLYDVIPYENNTAKGFMKFCGKSPSDDYYTVRTTNCAGSVLLDDITADLWHRFGIEWNGTQIRINVDGGAWSAWVSKTLTTGINGISIGNDQGYSQNYFDTLDDEYEPTPPIIPGNWPIISGTDPADGETSIVDYDDIDLVGNIQIPSASPYTWTQITAKFTESGGIDVFYQDIPFVQDLVGGDDYTYIATTTIEADPGKLYAVSYYAFGYLNDPQYPVSVTYPYIPAGTYITETGTNPVGGIPLINVDEWEPPALENCDLEEYNFLEKMTCKIQNSLLGLVIPSKESVKSLFGTLAAFQTKFPFGYVSAIMDTLEGIIAGVNESGAITLSLFGHSGNIDLSFWQNTVIVNGFTTSLGGIIHTVFLAVLLIVFLLWGLNYLHRIL